MRIRPIQSSIETGIAPTVRAPLGITSGFAEGLGQVGQAISGSGEAAGQISRTLQIIEAKEKAFSDSVSLTELANQAKVSVFDHKALIQETDYLDIPETNKKGLERIKQETFDAAIAIGPEVAENWKKVWSTIEADTIIDVGRIKLEKFGQRTVAGGISYINLLQGEAVKATLEGDTEKLELLNQSVNTVADNLRKNFKVPGAMAEGMKEGYRKGVEAKVLAAEREAQRLSEKSLLTGAYLGVSQAAKDPETGKTDYTKAYELLRQPGTLEQYGITAEQKRELTNIFVNEQAREKEVTDKALEQERKILLPMVSDGTATIEQIRESTLPEKEKYTLEGKLRARSKAINAGKEDPFKVYDPGKRAEVSRLIRTDPGLIESKGGIDYIYSLVGKGTDGGITVEQAERFVGEYEKRNEPSDPKDPLKQETYKQAAGSLDLFRRNWHFIEAEVGDDIDDAEASENEYTYGKLVEELESRVKEGEKPYEVLEDIMRPFAEKESGSIIGWFLDWMKDYPAGQTLEEGAIKKGIELGKGARIERKEIKTPKIKKIPIAKDDRSRAIEILKRNGLLINEDSIKQVMEQF